MAGEHPAILDQSQAPACQGDGDDADEDRAEHAVVAQYRDHQETYRRQQWARLVQRTQLDQRGRAVDDDTGGFKADQPQEQADPAPMAWRRLTGMLLSNHSRTRERVRAMNSTPDTNTAPNAASQV